MAETFKIVQIKNHDEGLKTGVVLPASKSESNRALIIQALAGLSGRVKNISSARDTETMRRLLGSGDNVLDVIDAGTTMRFLTAYLAVTNQKKTLTGSHRMCERPVGILVDALRQVGASIEYLEKEGYPPLHIAGFRETHNNQIEMRGDVSSQFISAMLMIGPMLKNGLKITLTGKIGSKPYIQMTLGLMGIFGVQSEWRDNRVIIPPQQYKKTTYTVSPDWSGASYWYSFVAMSDQAEITLFGFQKNSLQGDQVIQKIMDPLGVRTEYSEKGIQLSKKKYDKKISVDFTDCPDLAQTVAVVCALKGINASFYGLESLKIKETDRIAALQKELNKINSNLTETGNGLWKLSRTKEKPLPENVTIETYDDHRMAMAFAPLATKMDLVINNPGVVVKSYPSFWDDMEQAGFVLKFS